jgi:hypothetical protein
MHLRWIRGFGGGTMLMKRKGKGKKGLLRKTCKFEMAFL